MINHFFVKDYLSFEEAKLFFQKGLVVFTGPSGSGKSILLNALLGTMAQSQSEAGMAQLEINSSMDLMDYGIEGDEEITTFKQIKQAKTRFFVNNQTITKKMMQEVSSKFVRYLSHKDMSDFEKHALLEIIDAQVAKKDANHAKRLHALKADYKTVQNTQKELNALQSDASRLEELREFAQFEVEKIAKINPKIGEDEELEHIKKRLSQKEKIEEKIAQAQAIFEFEHRVNQALATLDIDSAFFDDAMNTLRMHFDTASSDMDELEDIDIESTLDRISELGELKRRYNSIKEALEYKATKEQELHTYENFDDELKALQQKLKDITQQVNEQADEIHVARMGVLEGIQTKLNAYLKALYLRTAKVTLDIAPLDSTGFDKLNIELDGTTLDQLSSGEFNRLRLALLAVKSELFHDQSGILVLDEIDANLSGEESMSVARVLTTLAKQFQIFAISHQPQLTSQAHQHFLIYKQHNISYAKPLDEAGRIDEIARMISGDKITQEAKDFAIKLRKEA